MEIYDYFKKDLANHAMLDDEWAGLYPDGWASYSGSCLHLLLESGDVQMDWGNAKVSIQTEDAKKTLEFLKLMKLNWQWLDTEDPGALFKTSDEKRAESAITGHYSPGLPAFYPSFGNDLVNEAEHSSGSIMIGSMAGVASLAEKYQTKLNESVKLTMLPKNADSEHYSAQLTLYGCILKESEESQAAYEFLQDISNLDEFWKTERSSLPVKISQTEIFLTMLQDNTMTVGDATYPMVEESVIETMRSWFNHIDKVYFYPIHAEEQILDALNWYYRGDVDEVVCLDHIKDILEEEIRQVLERIA